MDRISQFRQYFHGISIAISTLLRYEKSNLCLLLPLLGGKNYGVIEMNLDIFQQRFSKMMGETYHWETKISDEMSQYVVDN